MAEGAIAGHGSSRSTRFALAKFRPPALPGTLVTRPVLRERLDEGAGQRLTVVVGSAGAGKSVLLADWAAARPAGVTAWLSCDRADADPARFWAGFIEAPRAVERGFGADAADLLAMDRKVSADVTASVANDAARLPAGSAVIVDDFHLAAAAVAAEMTDLVERWPSETVQLVLAGRFDPPLRQHRLRMSGQLCEIRDRDLYFSLEESRDLLANFSVRICDADLALLHQRSEGWPAVLQMAALSLRGTADPARVARAIEVRGPAIADYFVSEVLDQQPPEVARFMLDTSVLAGVLTADACAAVTGRQDAAALLRRIDAAHLFLAALDDERSSFRYHHLVRQVLRAELRARDRAREQVLQVRAAEWFKATGDTRQAAHHYLAARQPDAALSLLQDRVVPDFLQSPTAPEPPDLSAVDPSVLVEAPEELLGLAADLLLSGDTARGGEYLDLLERARPSIAPQSRLAARVAAIRSFRYTVTGQLPMAVGEALRARAIQEQMQCSDAWNAAVPLILLRVYPCMGAFQAVERESAAFLEMPSLPVSAKLVLVPGALALARFESGRLAEAADAARSADAAARRLGFDRHFFAVDHLRVLAGLALERRDLAIADDLIEQVLHLSERRPLFEFLALLDRAQIWAARGQLRKALATIESSRRVLAEASSTLLARADEQEALLRLSLGDLRSAAELTSRLPVVRRELLQARIAVTAGDHQAAQQHLQAVRPGDLTPRLALLRQLLLAAAAIERDDPAAAGMLGGALHTARSHGFLNSVITAAPQVAGYVVEHAAQLRDDPFIERLVAAALEVRAIQPASPASSRMLIEPLTAAEQRVLALLPTSTYLQMADVLYISHNTVKTHLRSIYRKLGVASRSQALQRAVSLRLL